MPIPTMLPSKVSHVAVASLLIVLLACSSEKVAGTPDGATPRNDGLSLVADSVIGVGDTLHWKVVRNGVAIDVASTLFASVSDPTVLSSSFYYPVIVGGAPGTTTISVKLPTSDPPVTATVRVKENRPTTVLSLGQTVTGQLVRNYSTDRYSVLLAAGDTIDLMTEGVGAGAELRSLDTRKRLSPTTGAGTRLIYAAIVATRSGTYDFDVTGRPECIRTTCIDANRGYTLKVRRSGPVFDFVDSRIRPVPSGGSAVDSLFVQNVGAGILKVRVEAATASVSVETPTVTARGPAQPASFSSVPADATPIAVRVSSNDPPGTPQPRAGVRFVIDSTAWTPFGAYTATTYLEVIVYDPAISLITTQYFDDIAVPPSGPIYAVAGQVAYAVDRNSGAITVLRSGPRNFQEIWAPADGKLYVHYENFFESDTIARLNADGSLTPIFGFTGRINAVTTVRDDGTMYVAQGSTLRSRSPEGVVTTLGVGIDPANGTMVYSAIDNALYYVTAGELRRFDLSTLAVTFRGKVDTSLRLSAVDGKGRLVGFTPNSGFVYFFDTTGKVVATVVPPATATTAAVQGDTLYGGGPPPSNRNYLWKRPVP